MTVPLIRVSVPGACMNNIVPFTVSECCRSHWAITVCKSSVTVETLLQLHSLALVRGHLESLISSVARICEYLSVYPGVQKDVNIL